MGFLLHIPDVAHHLQRTAALRLQQQYGIARRQYRLVALTALDTRSPPRVVSTLP